MIRCEACGHENDDTRVFCQNCGARLGSAGEHVAGAEPARQYRPVPQAPAQKKKSRHFPGCVALLRDGLWTLALGAILAILVQAMRMPDGVPLAVSARPALASLLAADIQSAIFSKYPRTVQVSEEAANNFLAARVEGVEGGAGFWRARLARVYTRYLQGRAIFGVEQRLAGHPVYLQLVVRPVPGGDRMGVAVESGHFGRLPVPPFLLGLFQKSFRPVLEALQTPIGWLAQAESISIAPEVMVVSWRGARN